ncbi:Membrane protein tms1 [Hypoxylon texense]
MSMFAKLPPELRLQIWDFALQQETQQESRYQALKLVYKTRLSVYKLPVYVRSCDAERALETMEANRKIRGVLYLNLQRDLFISCWTATEPMPPRWPHRSITEAISLDSTTKKKGCPVVSSRPQSATERFHNPWSTIGIQIPVYWTTTKDEGAKVYHKAAGNRHESNSSTPFTLRPWRSPVTQNTRIRTSVPRATRNSSTRGRVRKIMEEALL